MIVKNKLISKILILVLAFSCCFSFYGCDTREDELKIYNWGEYIEPQILDDFPAWYLEQTGKKVSISYKEFSTNEDLYTTIARKKQDWDLICPSDYMLARLIREGHLQKLDTDIVTKEDMNKIMPTLVNIAKNYDEGNQYSVPHIWGTFGIMYNSNYVKNPEDMDSWSALWSEKYKKEIWMKDASRDAYTAASLYYNRDKLKAASNNFTDYNTKEYNSLMDDIFTNVSNERLTTAKQELIKQKKVVKKHEVDQGKDGMFDGDGTLGLFWSCDAGYVMFDTDDGPGNKDLFYVLPKEGSNVWVDAFAIPKYAKNTEAANYFIKYLLTDEVSRLNAEYVGSSTANQAAMDAYKEDLILDEDGYFNGTKSGFKDMFIEMLFPSAETLARCRVMSDFKEYNLGLEKMWLEVLQSD